MRARVAFLLMIVLATGCASAPKTARVADVTKGDYYTNEEIKGLSVGDRNKYCEALQTQINALHAEADRFNTSADSLASAADSLRQVNASLSTQIRDLDNEVRQLRLARRSTTSYVVKAGDTLQKISESIFSTPDRAKDIFEANKTVLGKFTDPLKPGIRLSIPAK
jgi:nucleoid-associated protein YgaU